MTGIDKGDGLYLILSRSISLKSCMSTQSFSHTLKPIGIKSCDSFWRISSEKTWPCYHAGWRCRTKPLAKNQKDQNGKSMVISREFAITFFVYPFYSICTIPIILTSSISWRWRATNDSKIAWKSSRCHAMSCLPRSWTKQLVVPVCGENISL